MGSEMFVQKLGAEEIVFVLHVFDPSLALRLRIDHERRSQSARGQNTVLNRQFVVGQTLRG